jgi:hypothetical protein
MGPKSRILDLGSGRISTGSEGSKRIRIFNACIYAILQAVLSAVIAYRRWLSLSSRGLRQSSLLTARESSLAWNRLHRRCVLDGLLRHRPTLFSPPSQAFHCALRVHVARASERRALTCSACATHALRMSY